MSQQRFLFSPSSYLTSQLKQNKKLYFLKQSMTKQIGDNSDWIKENLAKLWGENQADYYANPSRYVNHEANVPANESPSAKSKHQHLHSRKSKTELSNADLNHDPLLDASQKSQHAKKMFRFSNMDDSNKQSKSIKNSQKSSSSSSLMTGAATAATTTTGGNPNNRGLYAYTIWENIRESSTNRLKQFDLDKELKVKFISNIFAPTFLTLSSLTISLKFFQLHLK